jgi:hypothetical protein
MQQKKDNYVITSNISQMCPHRFPAGSRTQSFLRKLRESVQGQSGAVSVWCAGAGKEELPEDMIPVPMVTPLRSAPSVYREVLVGLNDESFNHIDRSGKYPISQAICPCLGNHLIYLHLGKLSPRTLRLDSNGSGYNKVRVRIRPVSGTLLDSGLSELRFKGLIKGV